MLRKWFPIVGLLLVTLAFVPLASSGADDKDDKESKFNLIYVPTDEKVIEKMFEMAKVGKNDVVFDLGCGDGRIVAMACKKFGCRGVGIDLNPQRIRECMDTIKKYEVESHVEKFMLEYRLGNALTQPDLNKASVVMLYMLPEFMDLLKPIAKKALKPGSRVVSHDYKWRGDDWEPEQTVTFQGPNRSHTLYLWTVKAKD
jgi:SAM-dependent methyltransferase